MTYDEKLRARPDENEQDEIECKRHLAMINQNLGAFLKAKEEMLRQNYFTEMQKPVIIPQTSLIDEQV